MTEYDGYTSWMVWAECPVDGFYPGSFETMKGTLYMGGGLPPADHAAEMVADCMGEIERQLRYWGVREEYMAECLASIIWVVDCRPAKFILDDAA